MREGTNNKIKVIKQVAYGYRNFLNFFVNTRICYT
ncbi:transposase [Enterococcus sp. ZJ1668]